MKKKTTNAKKWIKIDDSRWSRAIRKRDRECVLCGSKKSLQAHHWIVTRNQSSKYRYDLRNGVTLCYGCHIHVVHRNPSVYILEKLKSICIARGIATQEDINEITANRHEVHKRGVGELENIGIALQSYLENHSGDGKSIDEGGLPTVLANSGEVK